MKGTPVKFGPKVKSKRKVWISVNKKGKHCIKTEADKGAKKAFKQATLVRFYGCFTLKPKALEAAKKLATRPVVK